MRWIFRLIGAVVVLVVLAFTAIAFLPGEKIAGFAAREISARTGRQVTISGEVTPVFYPVLGVRTGPVEIANAEWAAAGPMVKADSLLVGVELIPLLSGAVKVRELRVERPVVRLEKSKTGKGNWELSAPSAGAKPSGSPSGGLGNASLADGRITDGEFTFIDRQSGISETVSGIDLAITATDITGEIDLNGGLKRNGESIRFSGKIGTFDQFLSGQVSAISLNATAGFAAMSIVGHAAISPLVAEMDVDINISQPKAAMSFGGLATDIPNSLGTPIAFSGKTTLAADGGIYARGAKITLGNNILNGDFDLSSGARPKLTAKLSAGDLNFTALAGDDAKSSTSEVKTDDGWSKAKIDASGLNALNADVVLKAASLDLGAIQFGEIRLRVQLDNGRLVADLGQAKAYDGTIAGQVVVNARSGLSVGGDITARGVALQPLLKDTAEYDRLIANSSFAVKILASGNSINALMHSLSGSGSVEIGSGEIVGFDITGMLKNLDTSFRGKGNKTVFDSIKASYQITGGVLENTDLVFESPILDATGTGQVDIGNKMVDYRITTIGSYKKSDDNGTSGVTFPVHITGPWSNMKFTPDIAKVIDKELEKQKKEAETKLKGTIDQAKSEAETKLRNDAETAVKEGVEKTLGDLLNKIKKP